MLKLMVVDDEAAHRRGMISLLNEIRPDYFIAEARDGSMAEILVQTIQPDIVFTDIRMPKKDGLEFLKSLNEANNEAKVVIISAYGQFEYAKTALNRGAFDYLLKPIDPDELENVLERLEASIQKRHAEAQSHNQYINLLLNKLMKNGLNGKEEKELEGIFPKGLPGVVFAMKNWIGEEGKRQETLLELRQKVKSEVNAFGHSIMFEMFESDVYFIGLIFFRSAMTDEEEAMPKLAKALKEVLPATGDYGLSGFFTRLIPSVEEAYRQAQTALESAFYKEQEAGILYGPWMEEDGQILGYVTSEETEILNRIQYKDENAVSEKLRNIFAYIKEKANMNPMRLKELFVWIGTRIVYSLQREKGFELSCDIMDQINRMLEANKLERLRAETETLFLILNRLMTASLDEGNQDMLERSISYIRKHFAEDISLLMVAEKFYFAPSYYSLIFKKRVGKNFSQYLTDIRIQNACRLLQSGGDKVNNIAVKSGYSDPAYFGKVFKKKIGCSPEEYRQRNFGL